MVELAEKAGLPRPEIEEIPGAVVVRFRSGRSVATKGEGVDLTGRQREVLALLPASDRGLALREIHARLEADATERQVREDLAGLKALGLASSSGHGRGARWNRS